jgi:hypothetical protein
VVIGTIHDEEAGNPRTGGRRAEEGSDRGPTSPESPPGPDSNVLDLFRFITTERHRFGAALALQILTTAEFKLSNFIVWFTRMSKDKRRKRLNSWKLYYEYCEDEHLTVDKVINSQHPNFYIMDFILRISQVNVKPYIRLMAKSAAIFLFGQLKNVKELGKDRMIMEFVASTASSIKAKLRYTTI